MNPFKTLSGKFRKKNPDSDEVETSVGMLRALNTTHAGFNPKHIYSGTVSQEEIRRRRNKNKMARASRRRNRGR